MVIDVGYAGKSMIECLKDIPQEKIDVVGINPFDRPLNSL